MHVGFSFLYSLNISLCDKEMSGKAIKATGALELRSGPQKSFPFVLKKIMDIPPPNILEEGDDGKISRSLGEKMTMRFFVSQCKMFRT